MERIWIERPWLNIGGLRGPGESVSDLIPQLVTIEAGGKP
jgi:hypothetical protein